jgi:hypothetical protein
MTLDLPIGDRQTRRDLAVAQAVSQQREHLQLARRQTAKSTIRGQCDLWHQISRLADDPVTGRGHVAGGIPPSARPPGIVACKSSLGDRIGLTAARGPIGGSMTGPGAQPAAAVRSWC